MKNALKSLLLSAVLLSGCATTSAHSGYVVKMNGLEANTSKTSEPDYFKYVVLAAIAGGLGYLAYEATKSDDPLTDDQIAQIEANRTRFFECSGMGLTGMALDDCRFN